MEYVDFELEWAYLKHFNKVAFFAIFMIIQKILIDFKKYKFQFLFSSSNDRLNDNFSLVLEFWLIFHKG